MPDRSSQRGSQSDTRGTRDQPEIDPESAQDRSQLDPPRARGRRPRRARQDPPEIDPKSTQDRPHLDPPCARSRAPPEPRARPPSRASAHATSPRARACRPPERACRAPERARRPPAFERGAHARTRARRCAGGRRARSGVRRSRSGGRARTCACLRRARARAPPEPHGRPHSRARAPPVRARAQRPPALRAPRPRVCARARHWMHEERAAKLDPPSVRPCTEIPQSRPSGSTTESYSPKAHPVCTLRSSGSNEGAQRLALCSTHPVIALVMMSVSPKSMAVVNIFSACLAGRAKTERRAAIARPPIPGRLVETRV